MRRPAKFDCGGLECEIDSHNSQGVVERKWGLIDDPIIVMCQAAPFGLRCLHQLYLYDENIATLNDGIPHFLPKALLFSNLTSSHFHIALQINEFCREGFLLLWE